MPKIVNARQNKFAEHLIGAVNGAMLALMLSVRDRTGLFEVMEPLPPSSSAEIAEAAELDERYVRECWRRWPPGVLSPTTPPR